MESSKSRQNEASSNLTVAGDRLSIRGDASNPGLLYRQKNYINGQGSGDQVVTDIYPYVCILGTEPIDYLYVQAIC